MTETEWLTAREPWEMLNFVREFASKRKLRLFACACCRQVLNPFAPRLSERALDAAEAFADGAITAELLAEVGQRVRQARDIAREVDNRNGTGYQSHLLNAVGYACLPDEELIARSMHHILRTAAWAAADMPEPIRAGESLSEFVAEQANQAELLRDICGNPFTSVGLEPEWLTDTVIGLAKGVYADYAFDRLPILADALQDAGCDSDDILDHCRADREHVRGCWVVDLLLGRR